MILRVFLFEIQFLSREVIYLSVKFCDMYSL